jgi:hypothetical protein
MGPIMTISIRWRIRFSRVSIRLDPTFSGCVQIGSQNLAVI